MEKKITKSEKELVRKKFPVFIQFVLALTLCIMGIIYLFIPELLLVLQILGVAFLWMGAYNNYVLYKKTCFAFLYILAGIIIVYEILMKFV
ncbi:MAG: hypothetical protein PHN72_04790 [Bacilli bacterium]|nr:hypothetical protein [Bacilli bacterium]